MGVIKNYDFGETSFYRVNLSLSDFLHKQKAEIA